jgi:hypothetical protein
MKESMNTQWPPTLPAPQQAPQHYLKPPPLTIFQKPIPHQGVMNTQQDIILAPPKIGKYQNSGPNQPRTPTDRNILLTSEEEILLQKHDRQYGLPPKYTLATLEIDPTTVEKPLMIPLPKTEPNPRIPHMSI